MTHPPTTTELPDPLADDLDGEDLACLGLRRANFLDAFSDLRKQWKEQAWERYAEPSKPPEPSVTTPVKRAEKAGRPVTSITTPDGLRTPAEAARKLRCSIKTLNGHVATGALGYVMIGHGKKRPRRMFTDSDLDNFIANQTRKEVPCPSTASRARHTGISTSTGEVIDFRGPRRPAPSGKRKR